MRLRDDPRTLRRSRCSKIDIWQRSKRSLPVEPTRLRWLLATYTKCTEPRMSLGTWLREISSCSCLTFLPGPAWVLLSKICKDFFSALYSIPGDLIGLDSLCTRALARMFTVKRELLRFIGSSQGSHESAAVCLSV